MLKVATEVGGADQQRARNFAHVLGALVLVADAFLLRVPVVPARARIHARHQHKRGGVFGTVFRPTDTYNPVFQRLPHHLQNGAIEFRQFIQAEELAPLQHPHNQLKSQKKRPKFVP